MLAFQFTELQECTLFCRKISHSILSDMTKIEQERPGGRNDSFRSYGAMDRQPKEDDWDRDEDSKSSRSNRDRDSDQPRSFEDYMNRLNVEDRKGSTKSSSYDDDYGKSSSSSAAYDRKPLANASDPRYKKPDVTASAGDDAQKKFGNAKSISSDMYFGNDKASDWETKSSNSSRFEGQNSISSAEYFGTGTAQSTSRSSNYSNMNIQTPDLSELKETVRSGITNVAGRLSTMANSVMSNIQDRYG